MKNLSDLHDWLDIQEHQMLGEILVAAGKVTLQNLGMALDVQQFENIRLGDILIKINVVTDDDIDQALIIQKHIDENIKKKG